MTFEVLNPGGRDRDQEFPNGAGSPNDPGHPPVNYHGYAACLRGAFLRDVRMCRADGVLVLLRKRNLRKALDAVRSLKARGATALVSCKESGSHQVAELLGDPNRWNFFREICREADGALSSTPELESLYESAGARFVEFIPTPYPVDSPAWDFSAPLNQRAGIFVGTREFDIPSRNHLAAVALADRLSREAGCGVTVINADGRRGAAMLAAFRNSNPALRMLEGPLPYAAYLREMARHRLVWQLDASAVPGQVAGDAILCGMPCVGGNGAVDRLAFPELSTPANREALRQRVRGLLADDTAWQAEVERSMIRAMEALSYSAVAKRMEGFLTRCSRRQP
jgi:hypothetical protein